MAIKILIEYFKRNKKKKETGLDNILMQIQSEMEKCKYL